MNIVRIVFDWPKAAFQKSINFMCHTHCWYRFYYVAKIGLKSLLLIEYLDLFYIVEIKNCLSATGDHDLHFSPAVDFYTKVELTLNDCF